MNSAGALYRSAQASNPQENPAVVEKAHQRQGKAQPDEGLHQRPCPLGNLVIEIGAKVRANQPLADPFESDQFIPEVDRERIGAKPEERSTPPVEPPGVDHQVEPGQQES